MAWKGIVGKSFKRDEFLAYVQGLKWGAWRPQFVVVHNTAAPTLAQWKAGNEAARIKNLERYYRDEQHWSAGPHLFIGPENIWVFTPLTTQGVHSPSFNSIALGFEMAGDYNREPFDPGVRDNVVRAIASVFSVLGLEPNEKTIRLHKEDPRTTHDCPGKNVSKADIIKRVAADLADLHGHHDHDPAQHVETPPAEPAKPDAPVLSRPRFTGITATVFGGKSDPNTSAYDGHTITDSEFGCALPARVASSRRWVRVYKGGKSADCKVVDVGPWNTRDAYWDSGNRPQAETGRDLSGRKTNKAGIDLTPAAAKAIGLGGTGVVDWEFIDKP